MIFSSHVLFAQVKIGTNPTVIGANNNLEVEASTTGRKFSVDKATGKVIIADGSQGNERILTSDANGVATWKPITQARIPEIVFVGMQPATNVITNWQGTFNRQVDRIPMTVREGSLPGWNATTKQYTIQEAGYYRVSAGVRITGTLAPPRVTRASVYLDPWKVLNVHENMSNAVGPVLPVFWEGTLNAGDLISLSVTNQPNGGPEQHLVTDMGFLSITKLF